MNNDILGVIGGFADKPTQTMMTLSFDGLVIPDSCTHDNFIEHAIKEQSIKQVQFGINNQYPMSDNGWKLLGEHGSIQMIDMVCEKFLPNNQLYYGLGLRGDMKVVKWVGITDDVVSSLISGGITGGNIPLLDLVYSRVKDINILTDQFTVNDLDTVQWLLKHNIYIPPDYVVFHDNVQMFQFMIRHRSSMSNYFISIAMSNDCFKIIEYMHSVDMPIVPCHNVSNKMLSYLNTLGYMVYLKNPTVEMLEWCLIHRPDLLTPYLYEEAILHHDVFHWLWDHHYRPYNNIIVMVICHDQIDIFKFLIENGYPLPPDSIQISVENGAAKIFTFLHTILPKYHDADELYQLASIDDDITPLYAEIYKHGYSINFDIINELGIDMVKLLYADRVDLTSYIQTKFTCDASLWLGEHGYPLPSNIIKHILKNDIHKDAVTADWMNMSVLQKVKWCNVPLQQSDMHYIDDIPTLKYYMTNSECANIDTRNSIPLNCVLHALHKENVTTMQWLVDQGVLLEESIFIGRYIGNHKSADTIKLFLSIAPHTTLDSQFIKNYYPRVYSILRKARIIS